MIEPRDINAIESQPEEIFKWIYGRSRPDCYIALGTRRKSRGKPEPFPHYFSALKVREMQNVLPGILEFHQEQIETHGTLYLMPNTLTAEALKHHPDAYSEAITEGRELYYQAKNKFVYELNAIWLDLDVGRGPEDSPEHISAGQAIGAMYDRAESGEIPWPSFMAKSGRGVYAFWLLQESERSSRPPLVKDAEHQWSLTVQSLLQQTQDLKSDSNAVRKANWVKAPDTIDTNTGNRVRYFYSREPGHPLVQIYTIPFLMNFLGLYSAQSAPELEAATEPQELTPLPALPPRPDATPRTTTTPTQKRERRGNPGGPYKSRFKDIEKLAVHRGGIQEGLRHITLLHYFSATRAFYRSSKYEYPQAWKEAYQNALKFNQAYCKPALENQEVKKCCSGHRPPREAKSTTIVSALNITEAEALELGLIALQPAKMKSATMKAKAESKDSNRRRREFIDAGLRAGKSAAALMECSQAQGFTISRALVSLRKKRIPEPSPGPELFTA